MIHSTPVCKKICQSLSKENPHENTPAQCESKMSKSRSMSPTSESQLQNCPTQNSSQSEHQGLSKENQPLITGTSWRNTRRKNRSTSLSLESQGQRSIPIQRSRSKSESKKKL